MQLQFEINNQKIKRVDNNEVVAHSKNYLTAHFTFSEDWDGIEKTAIFKNNRNVYYVLLEDDTCLVPWEVIKQSHFKVSLFGGDLITVDEIEVSVLKSGLENGKTPTEPTPDVYNQILLTSTNAETIAQSVREDLDGINEVLDAINGEVL